MRFFRQIEHTADIRLKVVGDSLPELFIAGLEGMNSLLKNQPFPTATLTLSRQVAITSPDATSLLIDFLSAALTLSYEKQAIFGKVEFQAFSESSLKARLWGTKVAKFEEDIKAVTYHEAEIKKNAQGQYETIIVFDI